ncbi:type I restriction-modification system subunit M N-terminal domain-containing protein [Acinetobacter sp. NIPH1876]|uniref:type I restriction-modification system subunit M N-terminal domain-containing protein n=1 Tax=Acinetobacter sp. NIPH1876 TaxID=2924041 RepID=UPI001FAB884D|nr:type I restriction-modification system subunit M N-terminal domain-containing protein [Acinetobacter sp. NIPH1876]MCJ0828976.1 type I restriction-modification system subunit M N-terminal domain-containing protein [Acinetobacter sp. NIPH1876]
MNLIELKQLEDQLWSAADSLRANTDLKPNEYSTPVLGLIFLKFADNKYAAAEDAILKEFNELRGSRREKSIAEIAIKHCGFYLPDNARYNYLLELPDSENLAKKIKEAMQEIEDHQGQDDFKDVLPRQGMAKLEATVPHVEPSFKKLKNALKDDAVIVQSVDELNEHWHALKPLKESFDAYITAFPQAVTKDLVADLNGKQKKLRASFTPFFKAIVDEAKVLDKAIREKEKAHNDLVKLTRAEVAEAILDLKLELTRLTNESIKLSHLISNNLTMLLGD